MRRPIPRARLANRGHGRRFRRVNTRSRATLLGRPTKSSASSSRESASNGPRDQLDQTNVTQPALYVCSMAIWRTLQQLLPSAQPAWMAGHSLGEFSALTAANALAFEDGLRLVHARGRFMQRAGDENPGAMAAILALDIAQVESLCADVSAATGETVVLANDNCPGQAVVSGDIEAVDRLIECATAAGARRGGQAVSQRCRALALDDGRIARLPGRCSQHGIFAARSARLWQRTGAAPPIGGGNRDGVGSAADTICALGPSQSVQS